MNAKNWVHNVILLLAAVAVTAAVIGALRWLGPVPVPAADETVSVRISEIMTRNESVMNADGRTCDWVELQNVSLRSVDLTGWGLTDGEDDVKYTFPRGTRLAAGEYLVVWCDKSGRGGLYAPFSLSGDGGESLILVGPDGKPKDTVVTLPSGKDETLLRGPDGALTLSREPTPGYPNTAEGRTAYLRTMYDPAGVEVTISEVMVKNLGAVTDEDGDLSDWLELRNDGRAPAILSGWYLSDDPGKPDRWTIPEGTVLAAGERLLVFASGKDRRTGELHASFSLKEGESVYLSAPSGEIRDRMDTAGLAEGRSRVMEHGDVWDTSWPTPGMPNDLDSYAALEAEKRCDSPLRIWEVSPVNFTTAPPDKGAYDFVEVQNVSGENLWLNGFTLTDDPSQPEKWAFPERRLRPGEKLLVRCSGQPELSTNKSVHASFSLAENEGVFLFRDGVRMDHVWLHDIPRGGSLGRMEGEEGYFYFASATPGRINRNGMRTVAAAPALDTPGGIYEDVSRVMVVIHSDDPVYYTTDGTVPTTRSKLYDTPFAIRETTVIRARAFPEGRLPSPTVTAGYFLNEGSTLPVASITGDIRELSKIMSMTWAGRETPANLCVYGAGEEINIDAGFRLYGHKSLELNKKNFKLVFRSRYGPTLLETDVFGEPLTLDALVLRAGQDTVSTVFREELFAALAEELSDRLVVQRTRYCSVYVNGAYYGVYSLKEAYSEQMYAAEHDVPVESVTLSQAPVSSRDPFQEVLAFARTHPLSREENYAAFCEMVDIDSLIDWLILESYSGNIDIQQNLRYFRSSAEDNKWRFALYDLDWSFYNFDNIFYVIERMSYNFQPAIYLVGLEQNESFKAEFCTRLAAALRGTLSEENVLSHIDELEAVLAPEMVRDRERWPTSGNWPREVARLRQVVCDGWTENLVRSVIHSFQLTDEEAQTYFSDWL